MNARDVQKAQEAALPRLDLAPYVGQWVAIYRGKYVVAHGVDVQAVKKWAGQPGVMVMPVPHTGLLI